MAGWGGGEPATYCTLSIKKPANPGTVHVGKVGIGTLSRRGPLIIALIQLICVTYYPGNNESFYG